MRKFFNYLFFKFFRYQESFAAQWPTWSNELWSARWHNEQNFVRHQGQIHSLKKKNLPQPLPSHTVSFDVNFCPVLSEVLTWSFRYEKLLICYQKLLVNIKSSPFWVSRPVFTHFCSKFKFFHQKWRFMTLFIQHNG